MTDVYDEFTTLLGRMAIDIQDCTHTSICIPVMREGRGRYDQLVLHIDTLHGWGLRWKVLRVQREHLAILQQCRVFHPAEV